MPELPEVEHVRQSLAVLLQGQVVEKVEVRLDRIVRRPSVSAFCERLAGQRVAHIGRRGKYLLIEWESGDVLVSHLRMEGRYGIAAAEEPREPHTHVIFYLQSGQELRYRDVRQFGTMDLLKMDELYLLPGLFTLGKEPLDEDFDAHYLQQAIGSRKAPIKAVLLDQKVIAGLGNIYVDEALFRAGVHPERVASRLKKMERERLVQAIREVIGEAVAAGGSSVKSYVNGFGEPGRFQSSLQVYGRQGLACVRCGEPIVKGRVAGRGTHVCLRCQPAPRDAVIGKGSKA